LRLRPTPEQKKKFDEWAGCTRFLYNKTIGCLTQQGNTIRGKNQLRARFTAVTKQTTKTKNSFFNNKEWLKDCPSAIRKLAVYDAMSNLKSCFSNLKAKNIKHFTSPFRSKKNQYLRGYSFALEKNNIKKQNDQLCIFKSILGEMRYFGTQQLHKLLPFNVPENDCKIQKDAFGDYYLIVPYEVKVPKIQPKNKLFTNPVALDPGIRKLITSYAPCSQESYMFGNRWSQRIMSHLLELDQEKDNKKSKKLRKRIHNLKIEMHYQISHFLTQKYDLILCPKLDTLKLSCKSTRRLKTKTVRAMMNAGHSKLFQCLKEKCQERGIGFLQVGEAYTSQTCPSCGTLHKVGETYNCKKCGFKCDRDMVGALGILLKAVR
jgi:putative transposase